MKEKKKNPEYTYSGMELLLREGIVLSPNPAMIHAENGEVILISKSLSDMTGYTLEDIPTIKDWVYNAIDIDYEEALNIFTELSEKHVPDHKMEFTIRTKTGDRRQWEVAFVPLGKLPDGRKAFLSVADDVSDFKQVEEDLKKLREDLEQLIDARTKDLDNSRKAAMNLMMDANLQKQVAEEALYMLEESNREIKKLSRAVEQSPATVVITDLQGNTEYVNTTYTEITGYTSEEAIGINLPLSNARDYPDNDFQELWKTIQSGKTWRGELKNKKKNGEIYWESASASPIFNEKDEITHFVLVREDITDRKRMENELIAAKEEAEAATKAKSDFLANMSHEIRTPMNAILGFANLLNRHISDPQLKSYIDSIHSSGKSLLALINDILDLSKVEAEKMELNPHYIDPIPLFKNMEDTFSLKIGKKKINFSIHLDPDLPESVYLDDVRMKQILFNLLDNAIKFTEKGYVKLTVEAVNRNKLYVMDEQKEVTDLIIKVEDTGIGIPIAEQDRIFQSFTQVRRQDYNKYGGTGLGLTICKRLVEMMNGEISVESEVNKGSTFIIKLWEIPVSDEITRKESRHIIDPEKIKFHKAKVLIVDDIDSHRQYLLEALHDTALETIEAHNGEEAVPLIRKGDFSLVITDIGMPGINGFELLKIIRNDEKFKHIPVIALTASAMSSQIKRIHQYDFNGLLIKPVSLDSLYNELIKYLPHTIPDEQAEEAGDIEPISQEALKSLPQIIGYLEGDLMLSWNRIEEQLSVEDITLFGKQISELGSKYDIQLLIRYGIRIKQSVNSFDVEMMMSDMKDFPKIIESLKKANEQV
ncbi:MAG: PAS domain S-box protein [Bacteroidetes bacterium]|nr:PAS domain S-box protein [Bacteroidota bacterium]